MKTRLLAAAVGLLILLPTLFWGGTLGVEILVPLVLLVVVTEYAAMAFPDDSTWGALWLGAALACSYSAGLYGPEGWWGPSLLAITLATMIAVTLRPGPVLSHAADRFARHIAGVSWLSLLAAIPLLRRLDDGLAWVFVVLVISWCGDTGGYFAGRFFGRTKLYPRISPKKTWEGVAGGMAFASVGLVVVRAVALPVLSVVDCVVMGVIFCGAGVLGDLSESMLKRAFDVKDSGWIMPGHGGLLDRIDSVLFVGPLVYGYAVWVKGIL